MSAHRATIPRHGAGARGVRNVGTLLALLAVASCIDKQLTTEAALRARAARLVASYRRQTGAPSGQLHISSFYLRSVTDSVPLYDQIIPLTPQTERITAAIDLTQCTDDPQRPEGSECSLGFRVVLRDSANAVVDSSAIAPMSVRPGMTVTVDASPPVISGGETGVGIRDVTVYSFSTPSASAQTYEWLFGDGASAAGTTATHVYSREGVFVLTLTARSAEGVRVTRRSVTIGSLTGTFERAPVDGISHELHIVQAGNTLTGTWNVIAAPNSTFNPTSTLVVVPGPLSGSLSSPRGLSLAQQTECLRTIAGGSVNDDLSQIGGNGVYGNPNCGNGATGGAFFFRRVSSSP